RLCFIGRGLMENRSGLIVNARLSRVSGHAERPAALDMVEHWADRGYDAANFIEELRSLNGRPHVVALNNRTGSGFYGWSTAALASRLALRATASGGCDLDPTASADGVHSCGRRRAPTACAVVSSTNCLRNSRGER